MPVHFQDEVYESNRGGVGGASLDKATREFQSNGHVQDCMVWPGDKPRPPLERLVRHYDSQMHREVLASETYKPRPYNRPPELGKPREHVPEELRTKFEYRTKSREGGVGEAMIWWPTTQHVSTHTFEKPSGRNQMGRWSTEWRAQDHQGTGHPPHSGGHSGHHHDYDPNYYDPQYFKHDHGFHDDHHHGHHHHEDSHHHHGEHHHEDHYHEGHYHGDHYHSDQHDNEGIVESRFYGAPRTTSATWRSPAGVESRLNKPPRLNSKLVTHTPNVSF